MPALQAKSGFAANRCGALASRHSGAWPHRAFTFCALSKTYGHMFRRCDVCHCYARLKLAGLHDVDNWTKTFSCSVCRSEADFCLVKPITGYGMADYRLDEVENLCIIRTLSGD